MKRNLRATIFSLVILTFTSCDGHKAKNEITCNDGLRITIHFNDDQLVSNLVFTKGGEKIDFGKDEAIPLFEHVLSPNGEWLLLPETAFGDFFFCRQKDAMKCLANASNFWRVSETSGHAVYYRFVRWNSPNSFIMTFAFNNEEEEWIIDLDKKTSEKSDHGSRVIFTPKFLEPALK
jgi:hypothetical protein